MHNGWPWETLSTLPSKVTNLIWTFRCFDDVKHYLSTRWIICMMTSWDAGAVVHAAARQPIVVRYCDAAHLLIPWLPPLLLLLGASRRRHGIRKNPPPRPLVTSVAVRSFLLSWTNLDERGRTGTLRRRAQRNRRLFVVFPAPGTPLEASPTISRSNLALRTLESWDAVTQGRLVSCRSRAPPSKD